MQLVYMRDINMLPPYTFLLPDEALTLGCAVTTTSRFAALPLDTAVPLVQEIAH